MLHRTAADKATFFKHSGRTRVVRYSMSNDGLNGRLSPTELLQQADALFAEADAALGQSPPDFATYQQKQAAARELIRQALAAMGN